MRAEDRSVGSVERLLHLRKAPIIGGLPTHQLAVVADAARLRMFAKGAVLLREGERANASYFLIEGRLHLEAGGKVVGHADPGASVGGLGILARTPAIVTATAEVDVLTLELDADTLIDLLEDHFDILIHLLREVNAKIIEGWRRLPPGSPPQAGSRGPAKVTSVRDLDLVERIFYLRQVGPFDRASINALAVLARGLSEVHFAAGDRLWAEGEPARHVVLVVGGEVDCHGRDGFSFRAGPGTPLGALDSVAGVPRWFDADAVGPVSGLLGEIEMLFDVFEDNLDMALQYLTSMSQWMLSLGVRLAEQGPHTLGTVAGFDVSRLGSEEEPESL